MTDPIVIEDAERLVVMRYAVAAPIYRAAGWKGVLPIPPGKKTPPPPGYTGADGEDPTDDQIEMWMKICPDWNVALRLPDGVIGIDIDSYSRKTGDVNLRAWLDEQGVDALPPTWISSARPNPLQSGIRFYRVTPGTEFVGTLCQDVDIIQHRHRYVVCWPSIHPDESEYRWYDPVGNLLDEGVVPPIGELS